MAMTSSPSSRLEPHAAVDALPDHRLDLGALVLQREIAVAGGVRPAKAGDLAAHPHMAVGVLHRALQRARTARRRSIPAMFGRSCAGLAGIRLDFCCGARLPMLNRFDSHR